MSTSPPSLNRWQQLPVIGIAAITSLLFTLLVMWQHPVLNDDAYGYLRAAALFQADGATAVFADYGWYSYSILIGAADYLLPGDMLAAAQMLNVLLQALLVVAFVQTSNILHRQRHGWLSALTILLFPLFNEMRYFLIRDFGFWAFVMVSLWQLLRFGESKRWQHAMLFALSLAVAASFRLEALLLAVLAPLGLVGSGRSRSIAVLYAMLLALAALVALLCLSLQLDLLALMQYAYRYYLPRANDLGNMLPDTASAVMQQLFTEDNYPGSDNTAIGLVIVLVGYGISMLASLVKALGIPVSLLLAHASWRGWLNAVPPWRGPLAAYTIGALLSLFAFVSIMHFLTQRYATLLCLLLLLQLPPVLDRWHQLLSARWPWHRALYAFALCYFLVDSLFSFGHSKQHVTLAGGWLRDSLPTASGLLTNSPYLAYASGRVDRYDEARLSVPDTLWRITPDTPLAVELKASEGGFRAMLDANPRLQLLQRFANDDGDEVRIYQVR